MLILWLSLATTANPVADERLARMTVLYERVCLRAFPDDAAVDAAMAAAGATALTPAQVKVTMGNDPARAWDLQDGGATLWLELPPFHACSVRWNTSAMPDLTAYRRLADEYESSRPGFASIKPFDSDQGAIHVHAVGEQRQLPDSSTEALFVFDQHVTDIGRRSAGETGVSVRFVHQYGPRAP